MKAGQTHRNTCIYAAPVVLDRRAQSESQETSGRIRYPVLSFSFSPHALPVTGVLACPGPGCQESFCMLGPKPMTRGGNVQIPCLQWMSQLNFPPKLCSIFKPQLPDTDCTHQPAIRLCSLAGCTHLINTDQQCQPHIYCKRELGPHALQGWG